MSLSGLSGRGREDPKALVSPPEAQGGTEEGQAEQSSSSGCQAAHPAWRRGVGAKGKGPGAPSLHPWGHSALAPPAQPGSPFCGPGRVPNPALPSASMEKPSSLRGRASPGATGAKTSRSHRSRAIPGRPARPPGPGTCPYLPTMVILDCSRDTPPLLSPVPGFLGLMQP